MNQTTTTNGDLPHQAVAGDGGYRVAARTAMVAGVFSLVVCVLLLYDYSQRRAKDPHETVAFKALRLALVEQPENEQLREQVRRMDLELRREYFRRRAFTAVGACLLLGGVLFFLIAAKSAATLRRKLPEPQPQATPVDRETQWTRTARWSVAGLAVMLMALALGLSVVSHSGMPEELAELLEPGVAEPPAGVAERPVVLPSDGEYRAMWPRFRGPGGSGISAYDNLPQSWDDLTGENIVWKVPVPLPGMNSPVVWGKRVFLSGAVKDRREVYCFDADTGEMVWQGDVRPHPQAGQMREPEHAGYAAPTVACDGRYVVAIFADGQLAAFELDGKPAWEKALGIPENSYGHASSLTTCGDLVLVQVDQGMPKESKSRLYAFRTATGEKAWEAKRPVATSWTTPILIDHGGREQLITCADPWVIAYDPQHGTELWRAGCLEDECGPSPVFSEGIVYVGNEYCGLSAIGVDGTGDVTDTHVLWTGDSGLPDTCSPLATGEYVLLLAAGPVTCYDAKDGEVLWEEYDAFDFPFFTSSPSLVGDRVYLFGELLKSEEDEQGKRLKHSKAWVVELGREGCTVVGEGRLDEGCVSSPAFQDGRIYVRGEKHLFCIGEK